MPRGCGFLSLELLNRVLTKGVFTKFTIKNKFTEVSLRKEFIYSLHIISRTISGRRWGDLAFYRNEIVIWREESDLWGEREGDLRLECWQLRQYYIV